MKCFARMLKIAARIAGARRRFACLDLNSVRTIIQLLDAAIVGVLATFGFWTARLQSSFGIRHQVNAIGGDEEQSKTLA